MAMRRGSNRSWVMGLAIVTLLVLSACSAAAPETTAAPASAPGSGAAAAEIGENLPADFEITLYQGDQPEGGDQVMFSDLVAQGHPVVLNFWAGLCPPCRLEMPDLQAVSDAYDGRILLFGLDVGPFTGLGSHEDGQALLNTLQITYPAGSTADTSVVRQYELRGMPATYFIQPDGTVFEVWTGLLTEARLTEIVEAMLAATS
jgi:thiol-disulfide isomerase/thioredoxin